MPQKIKGGSKTVSKLEGVILKEKVTIECTKQTINSGELLKATESNGEITYEGCSVKGKATCEVPNIKFKLKDVLTGRYAGRARCVPPGRSK